MTIQQLHYIISVDEYRHFAQAAKACSVTQSTLSSMVQKLEQELDVIIFDRKSQPVKPTGLGKKIIDQAKVIIYHASQMEELVRLEKDQDAGDVRMGILPSVAPYILPQLFKRIGKEAPKLKLEAMELRSHELVDMLNRAELDMAILTTPIQAENLIEIPLYTESFYAYIAPKEEDVKADAAVVPLTTLKGVACQGKASLLGNTYCPKNTQVVALGDAQSQFSTAFEEGSTDTLIRIVDANGGFTTVPELHLNLLKKCQKKNVHTLDDPQSRTIALYIRTDFVKERLLNIIIDQIKNIVPTNMLDTRLTKFAVRL